jgi:hypothetical protein
MNACQWPGCAAPATVGPHVDRIAARAARVGLCAEHHQEFERRWRAEYKRWRGRGAGRPSPRDVAVSLGIGLGDGAGILR